MPTKEASVVGASLATNNALNTLKNAAIVAAFGPASEYLQYLSIHDLYIYAGAFFGVAVILGTHSEWKALTSHEQSENPATTWVNAILNDALSANPKVKHGLAIAIGFTTGQVMGMALNPNESAGMVTGDERTVLTAFMVRTAIALMTTISLNTAINHGYMEPVNHAVDFASERLKAGLNFIWEAGNFPEWEEWNAGWPGLAYSPDTLQARFIAQQK